MFLFLMKKIMTNKKNPLLPVHYKFNEGDLINELQQYIDNTYHEHYSEHKFQATEFIMDGGHGEGFCIGNILTEEPDG